MNTTAGVRLETPQASQLPPIRTPNLGHVILCGQNIKVASQPNCVQTRKVRNAHGPVTSALKEGQGAL